MVVEALILDGENRVDEVRRDNRQGCIRPLLLEDAEDEASVVVEDRGRLVHLPDLRNRLFIRQSLLKLDEIPARNDG